MGPGGGDLARFRGMPQLPRRAARASPNKTAPLPNMGRPSGDEAVLPQVPPGTVGGREF